MQTDDHFSHSKTLDNIPVYRNVNRRPGKSAFNDLLDEDDDSGAAEIALRKANQVRFNTNEFMMPTMETHHEVAIQSVFQRSVFYPTRYGDGSYPVWYGSMDQLTTIYETAYHFIKEEMILGGHTEPIERQRIVYKVACTAILIDLSGNKKDAPILIDTENYSFTQQVGKRIRNEGHPGLMAPSARHQNGVNIAIFKPDVLSSPEIVGEYIYHFTTSSMQVSISEKNGKSSASLSIEKGHQWLSYYDNEPLVRKQ